MVILMPPRVVEWALCKPWHGRVFAQGLTRIPLLPPSLRGFQSARPSFEHITPAIRLPRRSSDEDSAILVLLNQRDWRDIHTTTRSGPVVPARQDDRSREDDYRPIHIGSPSRISSQRRQREEGEDESDHEKRQRDVVDWRSPSTKRPTSRQKCLASPSLQSNAADRDDVGK